MFCLVLLDINLCFTGVCIGVSCCGLYISWYVFNIVVVLSIFCTLFSVTILLFPSHLFCGLTTQEHKPDILQIYFYLLWGLLISGMYFYFIEVFVSSFSSFPSWSIIYVKALRFNCPVFHQNIFRYFYLIFLCYLLFDSISFSVAYFQLWLSEGYLFFLDQLFKTNFCGGRGQENVHILKGQQVTQDEIIYPKWDC